jgi:hypothetical protein
VDLGQVPVKEAALSSTSMIASLSAQRLGPGSNKGKATKMTSITFLNIGPSFLKSYKTNHLQVAAQGIASVNGLPLSLNTLAQKVGNLPHFI